MLWRYNNPYELAHYGIKNMRWGQRLYQNKDGSLTVLGRARYRKKVKAAAKAKAESERQAETIEQKRERLLKSANAKEIYKDRDVLTTTELKARIDRINTERDLARLASETKSKGKQFVEKALSIGGTMNDVYEFTQKPMMKALTKELKKMMGEAIEQNNASNSKNNQKK